MNLFKSGVTTVFVGCCLSSTVAHAQDNRAYQREKPDAFDVIISEVCYLAEEGQSEWVELTNVADNDVDIAGWELTDGGALNFIFSASSLVMPPKSYLVVRLDGSGRVPNVTDKMRVTTYSPAGVKGNFLGDKGGQLALYSATFNPFSLG